VQRTRPIIYRAKVLGRALLATRTDANSFWILLSGNAEVAFPSTTATTTLATNIPPPAAATAIANAAAIATTAVITVTATRAAFTTGSSVAAAAAANVATPTACQKCKSRP
jgi:hypothetical protein